MSTVKRLPEFHDLLFMHGSDFVSENLSQPCTKGDVLK
jgi:hypothetical protein